MSTTYSIGSAFYHIQEQLSQLYDKGEASAIAHELMQHISRLSKIERLMAKDQLLDSLQQNELEYLLDELMQHKPLQYVLREAWFMEEAYYVDENVLIPRPETEELVEWISQEHNTKDALRILDIGTGSGCIPIALYKRLPQARIYACDISENALAVARKNATALQANIDFFLADILAPDPKVMPETLDIIVSNPPYIPAMEQQEMEIHVKEFEPHNALFVPDNDPLLFYKAIAQFGQLHLKAGASVYCEIHKDFHEACIAVFEQAGYTQVLARKDFHDNWRMLKALKA